MSYHRTHLTARQMSDRLLLAHYDTGKTMHHLRQARQNLLFMLSQDHTSVFEARDMLVDIIESAIDDVHDMDVTFEDYAESVVDALLENVVPMPERDEQ